MLSDLYCLNCLVFTLNTIKKTFLLKTMLIGRRKAVLAETEPKEAFLSDSLCKIPDVSRCKKGARGHSNVECKKGAKGPSMMDAKREAKIFLFPADLDYPQKTDINKIQLFSNPFSHLGNKTTFIMKCKKGAKLYANFLPGTQLSNGFVALNFWGS